MSCDALALLYAYQETALTNVHPSKLDRVDPVTQIAPRDLIELASLFQCATESSDVSLVMQETLDLARLKEIDKAARQMLPDVLNSLKNLHVSASWDVDR